jgi:hypothetical protein
MDMLIFWMIPTDFLLNTGKKIIDDSWCHVAGSDVSAAGAASLHQASDFLLSFSISYMYMIFNVTLIACI